jgi:outer membrane lipase/esterase
MTGLMNETAAQSALQGTAQNPNQGSVAVNIDDICPRMAAAGGAPAGQGTLPGDQQDLFDRCNGAIVLANTGQSGAAADALGQIAAEEVVSQESAVNGTVAPQSRAIAARLSVLGGRIGGGRLADASPAESVQLASTQLAQGVPQDVTTSREFPGGLGAFVNVSHNFGDKDETSLEAGFDFTNSGMTAGVDYFFLDNLVAGGAIGGAVTDIQIDNRGGDIQSGAVSFSLYTLWNPLDQLGFTGFFNYALIDFDTERVLDYTDPNGVVLRRAQADTDANQFEISGGAYYDFTRGPWTYGPTVRAGFLRTDVDGFRETGAQGLDLKFDDQAAESLQTALGGAVSYVLSVPFGIMTFQGRGEWVHEFLDDSRTINVRYVNDPFPDSPTIRITSDDPDRDRFLLGVGATAVWEGGSSAFVDFETALGHKNVTSHAITLGARYEF